MGVQSGTGSGVMRSHFWRQRLLLPPARLLKTMGGLFGDWAGMKPKLQRHGIAISSENKGSIGIVKNGVVKDGSVPIDRLDLSIGVQTEEAGLFKDGRFFVNLIYTRGGRLSRDYVGDLQGASNIEAPTGVRLFQLWFEQTFLHNRLSVLVGQHDMNAEFDVTRFGGLFLNSSFGIAPDISGNTSASVFPNAGLCARLKWEPADRISLLGAVYDGDPGDKIRNPHGVDWKLSSQEGVLGIGEVQIHLGETEKGYGGHYKLGVWTHSADVEVSVDYFGTIRGYPRDLGVYFVADQVLYCENGDQGLGVFLQAGVAPKDRNPVSNYLGLGFHYLGLIPHRDCDETGLALARAGHTDHAAAQANGVETTLEATHKLRLTPWLFVQADLQVIRNPGGVTPVRRSAIAGMCMVGVVF